MGELIRELRSAGLVDADVKGRTVRGYAAVYDSPWNDALVEQTGYVEKIARGAFRTAMKSAGNVPLLREHDRRTMLATTRNKGLRLKDEPKGLYFEADLPNTTLGNDTLEEIRCGNVWGMSYGMASDPAKDSTYTRNPNTRTINTIQRLLDVTLTWEPSYEAATVELRSQGFVAVPMQELFVGAEEQGEDAAGDFSSLDGSHFKSRLRELEASILEQGGLLP
jgi:Escherichia/Staphylococcus phage prohead protease